VNLLNPSHLFASLVWSCVGLGYCVYGKKQRSWAPLVGGVSMIAVSYLADSVLVMSLVGIGLMAFVYVLVKRGW
jgi:hypothetical protein